VACRRDFRVYVPVDSQLAGALTLDVPCPHCHRHRVEVLIGLVSGPILVEPADRTWIEWRLRRMARIIDVARRTVVIRVGQFVRALARLGRLEPRRRP